MSLISALRPSAARLSTLASSRPAPRTRNFATYIPPKCRTRTLLAGVYLSAALTLPFVPPILESRRVKLEGAMGKRPLEWKVVCPMGKC